MKPEIGVARSEARGTASDPVTAVEPAYGGLAAALITWSLLAVVLAEIGSFPGWALAAASLVSVLVGLSFWRLQRPSVKRVSRREILFIAMILLAGLLLYAWPAEHYFLLGDSAIYPNTAARLVKEGDLTYTFTPLDGLTAAQKELFFVPGASQFSHAPIESYSGLLDGAYYVMDVAQNEIVASRPPLIMVWMGLFGKLFGLRSMLYVTPVFGVLSLLAVYFLGKRLFGRSAGALAAVWLLLSFPQLHFSRTPYAEVIGQFFVLATLYYLVVYLQTRRIALMLAGLAALAVSFAARVDAVLVLSAIVFFLLILLRRRDVKGLLVGLAGLAAGLGYTVLTVNRPYVGSTIELLLAGHLHALTRPAVFVSLLVGGLLVFGLTVVAVRRVSVLPKQRIVRGGIILFMVLAVGYALHVRPLMPEYTWLGGQQLETHNNEIMAITAQYISPVAFWLAVGGASLAIWRRRLFSEQNLLVVFVVSLASILFWKYTTARVYPVALRRLLPEVLPGVMLLGAFALSWLAQRRRWRPVALALAGLVAAWQIGVSGPYWFYREAPGAWDFIQTLAERLDPDALVLFEPQKGDSVVGWFAAPLWSIYDRQALLLNQGPLDARTLDGALCHWQQEGRTVYVMAQRDPVQWWPGEFRGSTEGQVNWPSSIIGQSMRFPPYIWRFDFMFTIYRLSSGACPA